MTSAFCHSDRSRHSERAKNLADNAVRTRFFAALRMTRRRALPDDEDGVPDGEAGVPQQKLFCIDVIRAVGKRLGGRSHGLAAPSRHLNWSDPMTRDLLRLISLISLGTLATSLLLPLGGPCRADNDWAGPAMQAPTLDKPAETPHPPATLPATVPATQPPAKGHAAAPAPKPKRELSPELAAFGDRVPGRPRSTPPGRVQHP